MNYYPVTDRRTESDAYEPTVEYAQVGSKMTDGITGNILWILTLLCHAVFSLESTWKSTRTDVYNN